MAAPARRARARQRLRQARPDPGARAGAACCAGPLAAALVLLAGALLALQPETARAQTAQTCREQLGAQALRHQARPELPPAVRYLGWERASTRVGIEGRYNASCRVTANVHSSWPSRASAGEFRALISTSAVDARDNTATTHTNTNLGLPIYWLGGLHGHLQRRPTRRLTTQTSTTAVGFQRTRLRNGVAQDGHLQSGPGEDTGGRWVEPAGARTVRSGEAPAIGNRDPAGAKQLTIKICRPLYGLPRSSPCGSRPGQVTGVMVDQVTHNSVRVRWTKPAEASAAPISRYTIWTRTRNADGTGWIVDDGDGGTTDANGWIRRGDVRPGSATSHTLTGLPSDVLQEVRMSARADRIGRVHPLRRQLGRGPVHHGGGRPAGRAGGADGERDRGLAHQPRRELERAGQHRAGHHRLRPAVPGGDERELHRRPAGRDRHLHGHRQP